MTSREIQFAKAGAIGVASGVLELGATTGWMHRLLAHKSYKLAPPIELVPRTIVWGTGIIPRDWVRVHRKHHDFADVPGDPHSPVLQGRFGVVKVIVNNPFLYHKEANQLENDDIPADLQPDKLDKLIYDKNGLGLATNFAGHIAANKAVGNPGYMGVVSFTIGKVLYLLGGDWVNGIGHAGKHPFKALIMGNIEPNDDSSYGADSKLVGALTLGEGNQRFHHDHPEEPFFGPNPNELTWMQKAVKDLGGTAVYALMRVGLAQKNDERIAVASIQEAT